MGSNASGTVLIIGPSGVGKTQLAVSLFEDPRDTATDLRLWVRAGSRSSVVTAFADAVDRLQIPVPDRANGDQKAAAFLDWLSVTCRSWLVVFDNASSPEELTGLWPRGPGRVIVTTYRRDAALTIGTGITVQLDVFNTEEALSYIETRVRAASRNGTETAVGVLDEAEEMAWDLGFLPVALAQAVSVILFQAISCADYRMNFKDRASRLSELFPDRLPADEYERTVDTTWSLAMEQADVLTPTGLGRRMAQLAAVIDPSGAPEALFLAEPSLAFLSGACLQSGQTGIPASVDKAKCRAAIRHLHALSLIEHQPGAPGMVRMHGLTQRSVRESLSGLDDAVLAVADSLGAIWDMHERDELNLLLANASHLIDTNVEVLWREGPHVVLERAGKSMAATGMIDAAVRHWEWLSEQAAIRLGQDDHETMAACANMADVYLSAGDFMRAINLLQQVLADGKRVLDRDHPLILQARNILAMAYKEAGNLTLAIKLFKQLAADTTRVVGPDHLSALMSRNNLAMAYMGAGNLTLAIKLFKQLAADTTRVMGPDHLSALMSRSNLALAYTEAGNPALAIDMLKQVMVLATRILGADHPHTLIFSRHLAEAYRRAGNLTFATEMFEQLLSRRTQVLGPNHPHILVSRIDVALAYADAGDFTFAIKLLKQITVEATRILGSDHPLTLTSRSGLACTYLKAGNGARAAKLLKQITVDATRILGPDHPLTLGVCQNLAAAHQNAVNNRNPMVSVTPGTAVAQPRAFRRQRGVEPDVLGY